MSLSYLAFSLVETHAEYLITAPFAGRLKVLWKFVIGVYSKPHVYSVSLISLLAYFFFFSVYFLGVPLHPSTLRLSRLLCISDRY